MIKKILLSLLGLIVLALLGFYIFVQASWNKTYDWPAPALKTTSDSTLIARGKYLVEGPAHCVSCHVSSFDDFVAADTGANVTLKGGVKFTMGPLGSMYTRNLTPDKKTGLGRYSDDQVFRMMRHGIRPNGKASMPLIMPFFNMADEDLIAIVSYLRTLDPVEHEVPENEWTFMGKVIRAISPNFKPIKNPEAPATAPPMAPTKERGEYLARYVTNCVGCHTPRDPMTYQPIGAEFSGGMEFEPWPEFYKYMNANPKMWLRTPNITPDPGGVLVKFKTPQEFIDRMRKGRQIPVSPMDWGPFSRMSDEDITAIYLFLSSLDPVQHDVGDISYIKEE